MDEYIIRDGERTVVCYRRYWDNYVGKAYTKPYEDSFIRIKRSLRRRFAIENGVFYSTECKTPEVWLFFNFLRKKRF